MNHSPVGSHPVRTRHYGLLASLISTTIGLSAVLWWLTTTAARAETSKPSGAPAGDFTPGAFFFGCLLAALLGVIVLIITAIRSNSRRP